MRSSLGMVSRKQTTSLKLYPTNSQFAPGITHISSTDPRSGSVAVSSSLATGSSSPPPFLARLSTFYRHFRATIKSIMASGESRRIFYFLCLNLAFMFVQMAYGIWTNSLGLISDCTFRLRPYRKHQLTIKCVVLRTAIHMFFDCLALGMGLFASVMANWPSNDVFTYGLVLLLAPPRCSKLTLFT